MKAINKTLTYVACGAVMLTQLVSLSSCKNEEDDLFDSSAAERLMQAERDYTARLASSEGGWAFEYYPTKETINPNEEAEADYLPQGLGYLMMAKFNIDNSVVVGMNNPFTNNVYQEDKSVWQVISDNGPVLTFNTYNNVLHTFSSPYPFYNSLGMGDNGTGVGGDYEFVIIDCKEDAEKITLKGKKRGTYNYLYRLPAGTDFAEYIADIQSFTKKVFPSGVKNYNCLTVKGDRFNMIDMASGDPNIYPADGDVIADQSFHPYLIVKKNDGKYYIHFRDNFTYRNNTSGATTDYELQELVYDADKDFFIDIQNPENTIQPETPFEYFVSTINSKAFSWQWNASSEMSDAYSAMYNALVESFKKVKYTLQSISLRTVSDNIVLRVSYKTGKSNSNADYVLDATVGENSVTFKYNADATKDAAKNVLKSLPELQNVLNQITQPITPSVADSKWDLTTIKLSSDANTWFVVKE